MQICFQCGSQLIFVSEETVQPEGTRYPQVNTVYRCSNEQCQEKKDKDRADRLKMQQKRVVIKQERMEKMQENRKVTKLANVQKST